MKHQKYSDTFEIKNNETLIQYSKGKLLKESKETFDVITELEYISD